MVIHISSNHPYSHKLASFQCYIHRLLNIPVSKTKYEQKLNYIKQRAVNNGYNHEIVDRIIFKNCVDKLYSYDILQKMGGYHFSYSRIQICIILRLVFVQHLIYEKNKR